MTNPLTLKTLAAQFNALFADFFAHQIDDPTHPEYGGIFNRAMGMTDPWAAERLIKLVAYAALYDQAINVEYIERANRAADFLLQAQRPSGLIDLRSVNIDSSPDTGFTVQALCALLDVVRRQDQSPAGEPAGWEALLGKIERFIRRAVPGLLTGGFHTPNHRWVITSALVYAHALFPDLEVAQTVEAYLAEGFDIDADGTFIERSIGVYDAVNNRSLLIIGEYWDRPDAFDAVAKNLDFNLHMLHADGTAITNLSRRQDYGRREVPTGLIPNYLLLNRQQPDQKWEGAATLLWRKSHERGQARLRDYGHIDWLLYALFKCGPPTPSPRQLPSDFARHYPVNGVWRVRRDQLSAAAFEGKTGLFSLSYGDAELSNLKISFTYFGKECGWFISDELSVTEKSALLHSTGMNHPRRPAYELPLGRPVPPEKWDEMMTERELRHLPPFAAQLEIQEVDDGFDLHLQTLDGMENVAGQIAFDFAPGGIWETANTLFRPLAGQSIFLTAGQGRMRYQSDVIEIGPGAGAHQFWQMRAAETAPDHVRVLTTFFTPVDLRLKLRVFRGLKGKNSE